MSVVLHCATEQQLLKAHIEGLSKTFGTTSTGADWCVKALHPSDPITEVRGIPDRSAVPSLLMNYQAILNVSAHAGSVGTWDFNATLLPHPIDFMVVDYSDSVAPAGTYVNLLNPQIDGVTHSAKYASFTALAQRWRLAYMGVTAIQNGSSMVNQGEIAAAQVPFQPAHLNVSGFVSTGNIVAIRSVNKYSVEDQPVFGNLQAMPNSYLNKSKEGAYVPLKLTDTCQDWVSEADGCGLLSEQVAQDPFYNYTVPKVEAPAWPHENLPPALSVGAGGDLTVRMAPTSPMLNGIAAHICGKGIDVATSFTFLVRCGIEMQVVPTSVLAPQLKLSPPYDPVSLDTYFAISRALKDAYPENYNSGDKLWAVVKQLARTIAPIVGGAFGGPVGVAGANAIVEGLAAIGDNIQTRRANNRSRTTRRTVAPSMNNLALGEALKASAQKPRPARKAKAKPKRNGKVQRAGSPLF